MTFAQIFTLICLDAESQHESADFWKIAQCMMGIDFLALDYDSIQSENLKHVWYIELILEHVFISHVCTCNEVHASA